MPAIVTALHDDDAVEAGVCPCDAQGVEGGFRSGVGELDFFDGGNMPADSLGEFSFERGRAGAHQGDAGLKSGLNGDVYVRVIVAEDERRKTGVVIDVFVAIGIPDMAAFSPDEDNVWLNSPINGNYSARDELEIFLEYPVAF